MGIMQKLVEVLVKLFPLYGKCEIGDCALTILNSGSMDEEVIERILGNAFLICESDTHIKMAAKEIKSLLRKESIPEKVQCR